MPADVTGWEIAEVQSASDHNNLSQYQLCSRQTQYKKQPRNKVHYKREIGLSFTITSSTQFLKTFKLRSLEEVWQTLTRK